MMCTWGWGEPSEIFGIDFDWMEGGSLAQFFLAKLGLEFWGNWDPAH